MLVSNASDIFQGDSRVVKVLLGSVVVYEYQINTPPPTEPEPEPEPEPEELNIVNPLVGQTVSLTANNFASAESTARVSITFSLNGYIYGNTSATDINVISADGFDTRWIINS